VGGRRPSPGIRVRVTAIAVTASALVLAVGGVAVVAVERRQLDADLDRSLAQRADVLVAEVQSGATTVAVGDDEDRLVQVVTAAGDIVAASRQLGRQPPIAAAVRPGTERHSSLGLDEDDHFRLLSRGVATRGGAVTVHVAENTDDVTDAVQALATALALVAGGAIVVLGGVVWWLVGRTLRPVERIRAEVATIGAGGLDRRVPASATGDEIARLAATMNEMLDRLQEASDRQSRFVSDASHELRAPLTRLRALVEVQLATPATTGDRAALGEVLTEADALQDLTDDLLELARLDGAAVPQRSEPVDLDDVALDEAGALRAVGVEVDTAGIGAAHVLGDARQLARAVRNLLDNASRHATGMVSVAVYERGGTATVEVADDGPGVPAGSEELIFERFTRLDVARDPNAARAGLGLAIARDIAIAHGGTLEVETGPDRGATFVLRLPSADHDKDAGDELG
jgi:signal transduction histidine kinase